MEYFKEKYLIGRLRNGDKDAFRQLFEHYYPVFLAFARRMLKEDHVAEDLIQNVFMRTWMLRERLDESRSLRNYLLVAVRNEIYYHLRSIGNRTHEGVEADIIDDSISLDNSISAKETEKKVAEIVSAMPERRQKIFIMSRQRKLSNQEIAQILGISVRTVEKHIENALADIRKKLS